jgi:hypothetical protein
METPIIVRAIASGGKFIGDLVGGYTVTISVPGQSPVTIKSKGSSGNTADVMQQQRSRTAPIPTNSDPTEMPGHSAAIAQTMVNIQKPVLGTFTVVGPGNFGGQQATVTTTAWLLPGIGLTGSSKFTNGLVVELPGLLVQKPTAKITANSLNVTAQVTMMCGCKIIDNNGIWVSTDFVVTAQQLDGNGNVLGTFPMQYVPFVSPTSTPSLFQTNVPAVNGVCSVRILANQKSLGNAGWIETDIFVLE